MNSPTKNIAKLKIIANKIILLARRAKKLVSSTRKPHSQYFPRHNSINVDPNNKDEATSILKNSETSN